MLKMKRVKPYVLLLFFLGLVSGCAQMEVENNLDSILNAENSFELFEDSNSTLSSFDNRGDATIMSGEGTIDLYGNLSTYFDLREFHYIGYTEDGNILFRNYDDTVIMQDDIMTGDISAVMDISTNADRYIMAILYENDWIVWSESNDKDLYIGSSTGGNWAVYAANLKTKEIVEIDSENDFFPTDRTFNAQPLGLSCKDNIVAYAGYEADASGVYKAVKIFNLETKTLKTIARHNEDTKGYSYPSVGAECVVYSISTMEDGVLKDNIIFKYTITDGEVSEIVNDYNLALPQTSGQYMTARQRSEKENESDRLHIYDFEIGMWIATIDDGSPIYEDLQYPLSINDVQMYNDYLVWRTTIDQEFYVYNIKENTYYKLLDISENMFMGYILHFNSKLLAWTENNAEQNAGQFNFVILK